MNNKDRFEPKGEFVRHTAFMHTNSPMQRVDVRCSCGWNAFADTHDECEEAYKAHVRSLSE